MIDHHQKGETDMVRSYINSRVSDFAIQKYCTSLHKCRAHQDKIYTRITQTLGASNWCNKLPWYIILYDHECTTPFTRLHATYANKLSRTNIAQLKRIFTVSQHTIRIRGVHTEDKDPDWMTPMHYYSSSNIKAIPYCAHQTPTAKLTSH